jgi:uncharacterized protein
VTVRLRVRVRPGARDERLRGWHGDGALKVEVTAPPEGGKANEAVVRLLADALGVRRIEVAVAQGHSSRSKVIEIEGIDEPELARRVERALAESGTERGR